MKGFSNVSRAATCASGVIPECFSRESVVAKRRDSVQKPYGMTSVWGGRTANYFCAVSRGFTLIELLVVVLIIGILAAVALPQYNVAVAKSRLVAGIPNVKAIAEAAETYYLANGEYPGSDFSKLDVTIPDMGTDYRFSHMADLFYPLTRVSSGVGVCLRNEPRVCYGQFFKYSTEHPGERWCYAGYNRTPAGQKICRSLGGEDTQDREYVNGYFYKLP